MKCCNVDIANHHGRSDSGSFEIFIAHYNTWYGSYLYHLASISTPFISGWNSIGGFYEIVPQNNILINSIVYNNVYIITADTSSLAVQGIWRMYYTKQNGLLEFDFFRGLSWFKI